ncbi:MAG: class I SAM-dependent methyltransferase, partial [Candidatus Dormiibacterota bacterium]
QVGAPSPRSDLRDNPQMALQRAFYGISYRLGRLPWDTGISPPELVEVVEGPDALAPGRALDLGCGTGTNAVYMARHGWKTTGVDFVPAAIARARQRAQTEGMDAVFVAGDVARLSDLGIAGPFDLVLDIGCFHGIPEALRSAYGDQVGQVTAPGATLLMFAFGQPARRWPPIGFLGATEADLITHLGHAFELVHVRHGEESRPGLQRLPTWYRMVRRSAEVPTMAR